MNKYVLIGLGVLTAGVIVYFVYFRKKKTAGSIPAGTPTPADQIDWARLEAVFKDGNPFNSERVKQKLEVSAYDENIERLFPENFPTATQPLENLPRVKVSKEFFDQYVLNTIRQQIRNKNTEWISKIEEERFQPWSGTSRAGYNNSLEQAIAYTMRGYVTLGKWYEDGSTPTNSNTPTSGSGTSGSGSSSGSGSGSTPTNSTGSNVNTRTEAQNQVYVNSLDWSGVLPSIVPDIKSATWKNTNVQDVIYANIGTTGYTYYLKVNNNNSTRPIFTTQYVNPRDPLFVNVDMTTYR